MTTTLGAVKGGRLCDKERRSWAASVSSGLRFDKGLMSSSYSKYFVGVEFRVALVKKSDEISEIKSCTLAVLNNK